MSIRKISFATLCLLALTLPFEFEQPLLTISSLSVTNLELLQLIVLGGTAWLAWSEGARPKLPRKHLALGIAFAIVLLLAAGMAPAHKGNALKAALRTIGGMALVPAFIILANTAQKQRQVVLALLLGGIVALMLGSAELLSPTHFLWLNTFRSKLATAGPYPRLTGSFSYTNAAAMYGEALIPLLVAYTVSLHKQRNRFYWLAIAATIFVIQAVQLTLSRAGLVTIVASLLFAVILSRRHSKEAARPWLWATALSLALIAINALTLPAYRLRLQTSGDQTWYQANIETSGTLILPPDSDVAVTLTITNLSPRKWHENAAFPIRLGARLYDSKSHIVSEPRWPFTPPLEPGQSVEMTVPLHTPPQAGAYELRWDIVEEDVTWFEQKNDQRTQSHVTIEQGATATLIGTVVNESVARTSTASTQTFIPPDPNRLELWQVALEMLRDHPLLGIGLDNYRLSYGTYFGWSDWNDTLHSNSWYVETAVSLGVMGTVIFMMWLCLLCWELIQSLTHLVSKDNNSLWQVAIRAALAVWFIHGLLDYFLLFNATGLLFWLIVGFYLSAMDSKITNRSSSIFH